MKKKKSWSNDEFRKYSGSRGDRNTWKNAAAGLLSDGSRNEFCDILGLKIVPSTLKELIRARNKAMMTHHPDRGGSPVMAQKVNEAFEKLSRLIKS